MRSFIILFRVLHNATQKIPVIHRLNDDSQGFIWFALSETLQKIKNICGVGVGLDALHDFDNSAVFV